MTLDEIAIKHGTDKATTHPVAGHGYAPHYDRLFSPLRDKPIKLLEIGVGGGESIRTWLDYFQVASVFGVDIVSCTNPWNTPESNADARYTFVQGDQGSASFWEEFVSKYSGAWDVIIDDGSHYSNHVIASFDSMWRHVNYGGMYCIEDLGVAYSSNTIFVPAGFQNHMDFIKDKLDDINHKRHDMASIHFSRELAIISKF